MYMYVILNVTSYSGSVTDTSGLGYYFTYNSSVLNHDPSYAFAPPSILTTYWIVSSSGFVVLSDERVKTPITGAYDDLSIINALSVRRFRHTDHLRFPGEDGQGLERIGFFAQEVQPVLPTAVITTKGTVPDIQAVCEWTGSNISYMGSNIAVGNTLNLVNQGGDIGGYNVTFVEVGASNIVIDAPEKLNGSNVFVYGHEVNDFLTVNYEPITACSVGAIQRLSQLVEALTARVAALEAKIFSLTTSSGMSSGLKIILNSATATSAPGGANAGRIQNDVGDLCLWSSNLVGICITAGTGNVGVGTTGASYPLTVAGDVSCSGYFRGDGSLLTNLPSSSVTLPQTLANTKPNCHTTYTSTDTGFSFNIGADLQSMNNTNAFIGGFAGSGTNSYTSIIMNSAADLDINIGNCITVTAPNGYIQFNTPLFSMSGISQFYGNTSVSGNLTISGTRTLSGTSTTATLQKIYVGKTSSSLTMDVSGTAAVSGATRVGSLGIAKDASGYALDVSCGVNVSGNVKQSIVSFCYKGNSTATSGAIMRYPSIVYEYGGTNFSVSTGRFTAPVAGVYSFSAGANVAAGNDLSIQIGGNNLGYVTNVSGAAQRMSISGIYSLAINDTAFVYDGGNGNTSDVYCFFAGVLLFAT